jgi:SNF2 family DNA or RNA helicase
MHKETMLTWAVESKPWEPHSYQKKSVKFLIEHAASGLFLDPGLGKTSIALAAIKFLKQRQLLNKVLLIAPLRVCHSVWPAEVAKWTDFAGLRLSLLHGPKKDDALKADADIYIINPEGLEWLLQLVKTRTMSGRTRVDFDMRRWKSFNFDTLVVDELTQFKHTQTVRFKALKLALSTFQRRWGLTGSPAPNGLLDLFGQCFVLDQGRSLSPYITHYRSKYFVQGYDGFSWELRAGAEEEIYERIAPLVLRMAAEDYLEMPQLIENDIYVDLPEDAMATYQHLERDLIAQLNRRVVVASNAASASMKCRQVANGGVYLDPEVKALLQQPKEKREWADLHTAKLDALEGLVEELQGSPLLVAYDFEHDLARLKARFGQGVPHIGGGVSPVKSNEIGKRWNAGKLPLLFGQPQSIAHGLNLQGSGYHVCWHSLTWDYERYDQLIRRVWRQGNQAKRVFVHHLIARNTIDESILETVRAKRSGQNALFDALKRLAAKRRK